MKKLIIVAAVICAMLASCQGSKNIKSFTTADSLSYAIGTDYGMHAKRLDSTMSASVIAMAIRDALANKSQMTQEEAYQFLNEWFSVRLPEKTLQEGIAWLEDVKKDSKVQESDSGLLYQIISAGDPAVQAIDDADQVVVKYRGTLQSGFEFDQNDSISFPLNRVINAWTEGMKLVGKGGEIILWAPADLAYGQRPPQGSPIPVNAALKFEVTLLDVIPAVTEETPAQ